MELKKGIYKHYKGNYYELIDVVTHSETLEKMVLYRALYGEYGLWVRPISMWNEIVNVNGKAVARFSLVDDQPDDIIDFGDAELGILFPPRMRDSHKGSYGFVALMGGCIEYSGAIRLAAMASAAMRSGAGVASVAVPSSIAQIVAGAVLESTVIQLDEKNGHIKFNNSQLDSIIKRYRIIALGMGIGLSDDVIKAVEYLLLNYRGVLIVDADGINALAKIDKEKIRNAGCKIILTPHLMEFAAVSGNSIEDIKANPVKLAKECAGDFNVIIALKGADSYITDGKTTYVSRSGSPGMATAGSGDVLAGIMSAVCAQNADKLLLAAAGACYINGRAGELAAEELGEQSMLSSDTIRHIADVFRGR